MTGHEFYAHVDKHPDLEWLDVAEDFPDLGDVAIIADRARDTQLAIAISSIRENSWEDLEDVLTGKRQAKIMTHLTRIVGYYSRVSNWNRSKLAELRDRQLGNYATPDQPKRKKKVMVPGVVGRKGAGAGGGIRTRTPVEGSVV